MRIVGLDVSLTGTGIAVHEPGGLTFVREVGEDGKKGAPLSERRARITRTTQEILQYVLVPDTALVLFEAKDFAAKWAGSAHDRSGLWWHLLLILHGAGIPVAQATPQTLKMYQTGSGTASKQDMLVAAVKRYPTVDIRTDNQADAMAALSMAVRHLELAPLEDAWNQKMAQAMSKAEWP